MSLKEKLREDVTVALKARDELQVATLRSVVGAIQSSEKAGKTAVEFDDQSVLQVLRKQVKQRKETAEIYQNAGEVERAERELAEASVLEAYIPAELNDADLEKLVTEAVGNFEQPTMRDFGAIMKSVVAAAAGRADGGRISKLVKATLSS